MTDTDVIGHLIEIEAEAANMIMDAQTEADNRILEAKQKADTIYKEKYEELIKTLENDFLQQKSEIDSNYDKNFEEFRATISTVNQDKRALNTKLESYLFGSDNG